MAPTVGAPETAETEDTPATAETPETTEPAKGTDVPALSAPADKGKQGPETAAANVDQPTVKVLNDTTLYKTNYDSNGRVTEESFPTVAKNGRIVAVDHAKRSAPERAEELEALKTEPLNAKLEPAKENQTGRVQPLGHRSPKTGTVYCRDDVTNRTAEHVTTHEFTHAASYQKTETLETDLQSITAQISGIRANVESLNKQTGEVEKSTYNRALNEGITEKATLEAEMEAYGYQPGASLKCYGPNMDYASQLESLVGKETVNDAYYNGNLKSLSSAVNELAQNESAWSSLNKQLDTVCSAVDPKNLTEEQRQAIDQAKQQLDELFAQMSKTKADLEKQKGA